MSCVLYDKCVRKCLVEPLGRISAKSLAPASIKFIGGTDEANVSFLNQVQQARPQDTILIRNTHYQAAFRLLSVRNDALTSTVTMFKSSSFPRCMLCASLISSSAESRGI